MQAAREHTAMQNAEELRAMRMEIEHDRRLTLLRHAWLLQIIPQTAERHNHEGPARGIFVADQGTTFSPCSLPTGISNSP